MVYCECPQFRRLQRFLLAPGGQHLVGEVGQRLLAAGSWVRAGFPAVRRGWERTPGHPLARGAVARGGAVLAPSACSRCRPGFSAPFSHLVSVVHGGLPGLRSCPRSCLSEVTRSPSSMCCLFVPLCLPFFLPSKKFHPNFKPLGKNTQ